MYTLDAHVYVIHPFNVKITTTENVYMHMTSRAAERIFIWGGTDKKGHYDIQKGYMQIAKYQQRVNASL